MYAVCGVEGNVVSICTRYSRPCSVPYVYEIRLHRRIICVESGVLGANDLGLFAGIKTSPMRGLVLRPPDPLSPLPPLNPPLASRLPVFRDSSFLSPWLVCG